MKYFSEITNEMYSTPEALAEAEAAVTKCTLDTCDDSSEDDTVASVPTKKDLVTKIEVAEKQLEQAYKEYELAKQQAQELSKKFLESLNGILNPAKKAVKDAELSRYNAIVEFNKHFGEYRKTYSGTRAASEFAKALAELNRLDKQWFRNWFMF